MAFTFVTIIFVLFLSINSINSTNDTQTPLTFMAALYTIPRDIGVIEWKGEKSIGYMGKVTWQPDAIAF
jgi:hypothetical protein